MLLLLFVWSSPRLYLVMARTKTARLKPISTRSVQVRAKQCLETGLKSYSPRSECSLISLCGFPPASLVFFQKHAGNASERLVTLKCPQVWISVWMFVFTLQCDRMTCPVLPGYNGYWRWIIDMMKLFTNGHHWLVSRPGPNTLS